jgi:hypothetical protein
MTVHADMLRTASGPLRHSACADSSVIFLLYDPTRRSGDVTPTLTNPCGALPRGWLAYPLFAFLGPG